MQTMRLAPMRRGSLTCCRGPISVEWIEQISGHAAGSTINAATVSPRKRRSLQQPPGAVTSCFWAIDRPVTNHAIENMITIVMLIASLQFRPAEAFLGAASLEMNWLELNSVAKRRGEGLLPALERGLQQSAAVQHSGEANLVNLASYSDRHANVSGPAPIGMKAAELASNLVAFPSPNNSQIKLFDGESGHQTDRKSDEEPDRQTR